ncbi:hypothetical protein [Amorphus sp. 3PC139-8]|uniref:hypothetical protein n=1 Tax=Amorphus sp. 3PC139-8 TaxID=2735676 RepID=UPI00345DCD6E
MSGSHEPDGEIWTFADFQPGMALGTIDLALDADRRAHWNEVYGESVGAAGAMVPQGLAVALMMDAYVKVIQPRPPGNVHAMQTLSFTGTDAAWGDLMHFDFNVGGKEMKRERRWVTFSVTGRTDADIILTGEIRAIWAA